MKDELAELVLSEIMEWDEEQVVGVVQDLQYLASVKYDDYEQYHPGIKFLESLAGWLSQLDKNERDVAIDFVRQKLVLISRAELFHLIEVVYPRILRQIFIDRTAQELNVARHRVAQIASSPRFKAMQRRTLLLGLSDGARLDQLRRASPGLSHEQFYLVPDLEQGRIKAMSDDLAKALTKLGLKEEPRTFCQVILVEDFSGSGYSLLSWRAKNREWGGKLWRVREGLKTLVDSGAVAEKHDVTVLLYMASWLARENLERDLPAAGLGAWHLRIAQEFGDHLRVSVGSPGFADLCKKYHDPVLNDEHKEQGQADPALGFGGADLPVILSHNTPNSSVSLLWGDTSEAEGSLRRRALFPRYERHHRDRP